jgi:hypothetical protein
VQCKLADRQFEHRPAASLVAPLQEYQIAGCGQGFQTPSNIRIGSALVRVKIRDRSTVPIWAAVRDIEICKTLQIAVLPVLDMRLQNFPVCPHARDQQCLTCPAELHRGERRGEFGILPRQIQIDRRKYLGTTVIETAAHNSFAAYRDALHRRPRKKPALRQHVLPFTAR